MPLLPDMRIASELSKEKTEAGSGTGCLGGKGVNRQRAGGVPFFGAVFGTGKRHDPCGGLRGLYCQRSESFSKQAKRVAFSEYLEELKLFLQLIGENLVLTGPIDEDDARSATEFLARESETLEERQGGDCSRHDGDGRPVGRSMLTKTLEIPSFPIHVPILGTSTFCLSEKPKRAVTVSGGARKINRRRLPSYAEAPAGRPVVCVRFPKPFQFLAHQPKSGENSNWRPSTKYARTLHDPDYSPDAGQFKLNLVYVTPKA